jgi:uncharacterized protein (TIGR03437 family)
LGVSAVGITISSLPDGVANVAYAGPAMTAAGGMPPYTWSVSGQPAGITLSSAGAWGGTPTVAGSYNVVVTVTDSTAPTALTSSVTYPLLVAGGFEITTPAIPNGILNNAYPGATLQVLGGTPPYHWSATGLPAGMTLDPNTGALSGTPTSAVTSALPNGQLATGAVRLADNTCRVEIDGQPAVVSYAGTSPGAIPGLVQINAVVPPTVKSGNAVPITVSVGATGTARRSQAGVTVSVK